MSNGQIILFPGEAESLIQSLKPMLPDLIGTTEWYKQQEYIDKLNLQALLSASNQTDEFVKEFLITHQKLDILIECLICIEIWKEKVFTKLIEMDNNSFQSFGIYTILYHEATLLNLLETVLYHEDAIESLQNGILDLFDYCYRRLCFLVSSSQNMEYRRTIYDIKNGTSKSENENQSKSSFHELLNQERVLKYEVSLKCISLLNYFINHIDMLPLSISTRLFSTFDIPILLVELVEKYPWVVELPDGQLYKFVENKWIQQANWLEVRHNITKLEGQVWLTIYQMLFSEKCREKYDLTGHRKTTVLKLRSYLTNVLLEHLPILNDLRMYLEQLSIMEVVNVKPSLILEQIAEFRETFLNTYENKWSSITENFCQRIQSNKFQEDLKQHADSWCATYNLDKIEQLITDIPRCVQCGKEAAKRCSRCKNEWYCRRECQVQHWKRHKISCDLFVNINNK